MLVRSALPSRLLRAALAAVVLAVAARAQAYEPRLHQLMTERAFHVSEVGTLQAPDAAALDAFRAELWRRLDAVPDPALHARWHQFAPTPSKLTSARLKALLMLNDERPLVGFDPMDVAAELDDRSILVLGAVLPDVDRRNQDRFWRDASGAVRRTPDGEPIPIDPAIAEMGAVTGTASQAHAHYQLLPATERTDELQTLERDPRRFSMPRDAHSFGADFVEIYAALSSIAGGWSVPEAPFLARLFEGNALHHMQDVCSPFHTVQVGLHAFLLDAQLEAWKQELRSLGGLFGERVRPRDVVVRIIANHHLFLEDLFSEHLVRGLQAQDGAMREVEGALHETDEEFAKRLAQQSDQAFERRLVSLAVELGSRDAARLYELSRQLAAEDLSRWSGRIYDERPETVDDYLRDRSGLDRNPAWRETLALQAAGFRRWATIADAWKRRQRASPEVAAERLLKLIVARQDEIAARQAGFVAQGRERLGLNWGLLGGVGALCVLALLALRSLLRRRRLVT